MANKKISDLTLVTLENTDRFIIERDGFSFAVADIATGDSVTELDAKTVKQSLFADLPAPSSGNVGAYYETEQGLYKSNGTAWLKVGYTKADVDTQLNTKQATITASNGVQLVGVDIQGINATTSAKGVTQLSNLYNGTSQILATTEKALSDGLATKQNTITTGTTAQYFRGDLSLSNFVTDAQSAVVEDAINNGTIDKAPSENAVFNALALKAPLASPTFTGSVIVPTPTLSTQATNKNYVDNIAIGGLKYQGTWNASTNTPTLSDGTSTSGYYYRVNVAGTQDLGSGSISFDVGDWVVYNPSGIWEKLDMTDAVSSVFGRTGAVTSQNGDYTASQITNTPAGNISATNVQSAINELDTKKIGAATTDTLTNKTFDTAGTGNVLKINGTQVSVATGSGSVVLSTSPALTTPDIGVASASSVNKVAITQPTTGSTLTISDGKTLTSNNTLTLAGTDGSTLNIGSGGTLGTAAYVNTGSSGSTVPLLNADNAWSGIQGFNTGKLKLNGSTSGSVIVNAPAIAGTNTLTLPAGTTDFSATGGSGQVVKQTSAGGAFTVAQVTASEIGAGTMNTNVSIPWACLSGSGQTIYYVNKTTGNDANNGQTPYTAFETIARANTVIGNAKAFVYILDNTNETLTITNTNISYGAVGMTQTGQIQLTGTITVANTTSVVSFAGIAFTTLNHTAVGSLYLENCSVGTAFSSSSSGYLKVINTDMSTATVSITGTGYKNFFDSSTLGALTINNAALLVTVKNSTVQSGVTITAGTFNLMQSNGFIASSASYFATVASGAIFVVSDSILQNVSDGSPARVQVVSGAYYVFNNLKYNNATSVISGTDLNAFVSRFGSIYATTAAITSLSLTNALPIASGGTNSSTSLTNSKVMVSSGGAIVESSITTTQLATIGTGTTLAKLAANTVTGADSGKVPQVDGSGNITFVTPTGGSGASILTTVTQNNSFTVGQWVTFLGGSYILADASDITKLPAVGIITAATSTQFTFQSAGAISGLTGLTANTLYSISNTTPGAIVATPSSPVSGQYIQNVLYATSSATGLVGVSFNVSAQANNTAVAPAVVYSVVSAKVDANGDPSFMTSASTQLNFDVSVPIVCCYSDGYVETNFSMLSIATGLSNGTNYIIKEAGNNQAYFTLLKPVEDKKAPSSPSTNQLWLDTSVKPYVSKKWNGSVWVTTRFVKLGQVLITGLVIGTPVNYALNGIYFGEKTQPYTSGSFASNMGTINYSVQKFGLLCLTTVAGVATAGNFYPVVARGTGGDAFSLYGYRQSDNTIDFGTYNVGWYINSDAGVQDAISGTNVNFKMVVVAKRDF